MTRQRRHLRRLMMIQSQRTHTYLILSLALRSLATLMSLRLIRLKSIQPHFRGTLIRSITHLLLLIQQRIINLLSNIRILLITPRRNRIMNPKLRRSHIRLTGTHNNPTTRRTTRQSASRNRNASITAPPNPLNGQTSSLLPINHRQSLPPRRRQRLTKPLRRSRIMTAIRYNHSARLRNFSILTIATLTSSSNKPENKPQVNLRRVSKGQTRQQERTGTSSN